MKIPAAVLALGLGVNIISFLLYRHLEIGEQVEQIAFLLMLSAVLLALIKKRAYKTLLAVFFAISPIILGAYFYNFSFIIVGWVLVICVALLIFIRVNWFMRILLLTFFLFPKALGLLAPIYFINTEERFGHMNLGDDFIFSYSWKNDIASIAYAKVPKLVEIVNNENTLLLSGKLRLLYVDKAFICGDFRPYSLADDDEIENDKKGYFILSKVTQTIHYQQSYQTITTTCKKDNIIAAITNKVLTGLF